MPIESNRQAALAPQDAPEQPGSASANDADDWSGVFCCSAMRPRPNDRPDPRPAAPQQWDDVFYGQ